MRQDISTVGCLIYTVKSGSMRGDCSMHALTVWLQSTVASIGRQSRQTLNCCFPVSPLAGDRPEMSQLQRFVGVAGGPIKMVEEVSPDSVVVSSGQCGEMNTFR